MSKKHLRHWWQPTYHTKNRQARVDAWWREEGNGIVVTTDGKSIRITWRQIVDAVERKYRANDKD